jgi:hypothetical protein
MTTEAFPSLDADAIRETRDALHAWSRVLGGWLKQSRAKRKHWWHASLRPSIEGLCTGVVRGDVDFDVELDLVSSRLRVRTTEREAVEELTGQSARSLAAWLDETLTDAGIDASLAPDDDLRSDAGYPGYDAVQARRLHGVISSVAAGLENLRAGVREETSPIQLWPHHFDLSMIWLPGSKVPGQDPAKEEYADKQMNFGFMFGDEAIPEPYFYVTAYPLPEAMPAVELPAGTTWRSEGFSGAVLLYRDLVAVDGPAAYLQDLWSRLLAAGQIHLAGED